MFDPNPLAHQFHLKEIERLAARNVAKDTFKGASNSIPGSVLATLVVASLAIVMFAAFAA